MEQEETILSLSENILDMCNPIKTILFSKKYSVSGELRSFKLCVIVPDDTEVTDLECKLYLQLDCENPFDILLYRKSEWEEFCLDNTSFANKVMKNGVVLYER